VRLLRLGHLGRFGLVELEQHVGDLGDGQALAPRSGQLDLLLIPLLAIENAALETALNLGGGRHIGCGVLLPAQICNWKHGCD